MELEGWNSMPPAQVLPNGKTRRERDAGERLFAGEGVLPHS